MTDREWMVAWALKGYPRQVSKEMMLSAPETAFDMLRVMREVGVLSAALPAGGRVQLGRVGEDWAVGIIGVGLLRRKTLEAAQAAVHWTLEHGRLPKPLCATHEPSGLTKFQACQLCDHREDCEHARL